MLLKPAPVSTRQFTYDKATRTFTAEISETNGLGRVWDDSTDEGLTLVSTRTGAEIVFVVVAEERDAEGELQAWKLSDVSPSRGFYMTLFND